ncbi:hypothetical protein BOTBODRAFT_52788 [Botryobasidium botryosum FD-172 SS1]|uniref:FAD-binding PCMH-type domain-containing protein n=1 Tax=Botryobasidium botryosum (strain FD-172 SS1) TaxID=930990 RepID=A0A067MQW8_BOTB1|nr:hypothetical protein BOTBODRAFT_52788 [Botryobasidium botryosum FD-172 SS1]
MAMGLEDFRASIEGLVTQPGDAEYTVRRWAANAQRPAAIVVFPRTPQDVAKSILFAQGAGYEIAIRGGGHSPSGASSTDGGLVIDLSKYLTGVRIDAEKQLAYVQGGAIFKTVEAEAIKYGLAINAGIWHETGVGGLTTGGGWGWLSSEYGLLIDRLVAATVVVANGDVLKASKDENPDLFWGIQGGGSNFGPVVEFVYELFPQRPDVFFNLMFFAPERLSDVINELNEWIRVRTVKEAGHLIFTLLPSGEPAIVLMAYFNGEEEEGKAKFQRLANLGPTFNRSERIPFVELNAKDGEFAIPGGCKFFKGAALSALEIEPIQRIWDAWLQMVNENPTAKRSVINMTLYDWEKVASVPRDAMAYYARNKVGAYNAVMILQWEEEEFTPRASQIGRSLGDLFAKLEGKEGGNYANFEDEDATAAFKHGKAKHMFGGNYERLRQIKKKYDPKLVFNKWYPIEPAA